MRLSGAHLYQKVCPSVRPPICPLVHLYVRLLCLWKKTAFHGCFWPRRDVILIQMINKHVLRASFTTMSLHLSVSSICKTQYPRQAIFELCNYQYHVHDEVSLYNDNSEHRALTAWALRKSRALRMEPLLPNLPTGDVTIILSFWSDLFNSWPRSLTDNNPLAPTLLSSSLSFLISFSSSLLDAALLVLSLLLHVAALVLSSLLDAAALVLSSLSDAA